jgi:hypothetical protein
MFYNWMRTLLIKYILRTQIPLGSRVLLAIDRTQWDSNNLLMVAVIWKKRSFPVYWQFLDKAGSSNISEQIAVIRPVLKLLSRYEVVLIGDREFRRVELAYWLKKRRYFLPCGSSRILISANRKETINS